jgi:hypothetical protein
MIPQEFLIPFLVTNIISAALVFSAIRWPRLTRVLFVLIFGAAGLFNIYTAVTEPQVYQTYKELAVLAFYRNFIDGFFSDHAQLIVLVIAAGQLCIGALLAGNGRVLSLGVLGGTIFLIAIAPLGLGSAFPATILMVGALIIMQRRLVRKQEQGRITNH